MHAESNRVQNSLDDNTEALLWRWDLKDLKQLPKQYVKAAKERRKQWQQASFSTQMSTDSKQTSAGSCGSISIDSRSLFGHKMPQQHKMQLPGIDCKAVMTHSTALHGICCENAAGKVLNALDMI